MKLLLVGAGGREHALGWKIRRSPLVSELVIAPGNAGTASLGRNVPVKADDIDGQVALARAERPDLVVVGPDNPLGLGLVDRLAAAGIKAFGPTAAAARIEASKAFAKDVMQRAGIPTAAFAVVDSYAQGERWVRRHGRPMVVKADGLALGKGVVVAATVEETLQVLRAMLDGALGDAGARVVLEEQLSGPEASLLAFADGATAVPMLAAQDHKRLLDNDQGPNTGGMGAYAPYVQLDDALRRELAATMLQPAIDAMAALGAPFRGVLYAGLMLTHEGPRMLEFNARFGDPEAQVLLPLLESDLVPIMLACAEGRLAPELVGWRPDAACGVVLAAEGYPERPRTGDPIAFPATAPADTLVFHAGTAERDGSVVTAGGRVLTAVGLGATPRAARDRAYALAESINFSGRQFRRDIGARALDEESAKTHEETRS